MTIVRIDDTQLTSGFKAVRKNYSLIGPVKDQNGNCKFRSLDKEEMPYLDFTNTNLSPKEFLFPQSESILEYHTDDCSDNNIFKEVTKDYHNRAIVGIRPCDAKANIILQMNFDTPNVKDPYWVKSYESTTFVGLACDDPCKNCFCTTVGSSPYGTKGLDVIIIPKKDNYYYAKIITEKGEKFVNIAGWKNDVLKDKPSIFEDRKAISEKKSIIQNLY